MATECYDNKCIFHGDYKSQISEGPYCHQDECRRTYEVTPDNYVYHVLRTDTPITTELIARFNNPDTVRLLHAAMGLCTESGELMDMLKRHIFYGKPLDFVNAKEEGGDITWYTGLLIDVLRTTFKEVMQMNIAKLRKRYPENFSEHRAIERDVETERKVMEEFVGFSLKENDWFAFSEEMRDHIKNYVIPQYGDKGDDPYSDNTVAEYVKQIEKYAKRYNQSARPGQEKLDLLKMAHCAQMAFTKLIEGEE